MTLVEATNRDIARFYGIKMQSDWFGWAVKTPQMIVGIGGAVNYADNDWIVFVDQKSKVLKPIHLRLAKKALSKLKGLGAGRVAAKCDETIKGADVFLKRLGFVDQGDGVWEWQH